MIPPNVGCYIVHHDDGTVECKTHNVQLKPEEVRAHIDEKNEEWAKQQEAAVQVQEKTNWERLAREDPGKFMAEMMKDSEKFRDSISTAMPENLRTMMRDMMEGYYEARYRMQLAEGDDITVIFRAMTLEDLRLKWDAVKKVFRA